MTAFIGTTDLEALLRRSLTPDESALATIALDSASEVVRDYCHQDFDDASATSIVLDGTGTQWVLLPQLPVNDVDSVTLYDGLGAEDALTETEEFLWYADGRLYRVGTVWPSDPQAITVVYDHGYTTIPASVRMVAAQVALRIMIQGIVRQESIGGYSVTYASDIGGFGLTPSEERVLSRYRYKRA